MAPSSCILVTGAGGLVGAALLGCLRDAGFANILTPSSAELDLRDARATNDFFLREKPDYVFHLAARVYGILGNMENKGLSFYDNVLMNLNVVEASRVAGVRKIVAMGSGAVYPYPIPRPLLHEDDVWSGKPHPSEDSYAHAKRAMLAQLVAYQEQYGTEFVFAISGNLYGPNDKYDQVHGHVTPSLVAKFYHAKVTGGRVSVWGNGSAQRDFMYSRDAARALICLMGNGTGAVNIGSGQIHPVRDVVSALAEVTGLQDRVDWDASMPNGQEFRAYNLDRLFALGFVAETTLREGVEQTYEWYSRNTALART